MKLSQLNELEYTDDMDWFDPIIEKDTKLFIDPFLVFKSEDPNFCHAHDKIMSFFGYIFERAASTPRTNNPSFRNLRKALNFPEVQELCLGYAESSNQGSGSGSVFGRLMLDAIYDSISMGIQDINHFEELGIFNVGIGCDRISDITARLILPELISYTNKIAEENNFKTETYRINNAFYNTKSKRWEYMDVKLPVNDTKVNQGLILVPKKFLSVLPTIDSNDFYDFCWENKNEDLRDQLNIDIKESLNKKDIVTLAKNNRAWVKEYTRYKENTTPRSYNFVEDPRGLYGWHDETLNFTLENPYSIEHPTDTESFIKVVDILINKFEDFIENNNGYKLLWNEKPNLKPKIEEAAQSLFTGIVKPYCESNDIDLSREPNLGRGPVDFKFSRGYRARVLVEVKKANNSRFWHGLQRQLPTYMRVENISIGYFLVLVYNEKDQEKISGIREVAKSISKDLGYQIKVIIVDATYEKASASSI